MKKQKKGNPFAAIPGMKSMRCPYCGSPIVLRSADGIYKENSANANLYVCSRYPKCDAYVRVHKGTNRPMGTLANPKLRAQRNEAHKAFDRLHLSGYMTRDEAYKWLAGLLQAPRSQAHIGYLGEYYCQLVIDESRKLLDARKRVAAGRSVHRSAHAMGGV